MIQTPRSILAIGLLLAVASGCEGESSSAQLDAGAPSARAARTALAKLRELKGPVFLEREAKRRPAAEESLFAHDVVETGADAEAQLHFADGRVVELGPDARLLVGEDATGVLLEVERGFILSRVPREAARGGAQVSIRILTPFGLTRVGEGESELTVEVGPDTAKVAVVIGTVELVSQNGQAVRAGAGETLSLTRGEIEVLGREEEQPPEVVMLAPIQVLIRADGKAELRRKGEKRWRQVGKGGDALGEGDDVRVRRGSSTLRLGDSPTAITLASGTELTLGKTASGDTGDQAALELKRGALELALAGGRRTVVDLPSLQLESDGGGYFHVEKTRDGIAVSSLTGDLVLRRNGKQQAVKAGEQLRVRNADAELGAASRQDEPELVLPSRTGTRVFHAGVPRALIDWRGEAGDYQVRVAEDPGYERIVLAGVVHQSKLAVDIPRRGSLYWEVRGADGKEVDSGSAVFAPEPQRKDLDRLRNEVPEGPDKTTIYYQDKPPAVTFTFAEEDGAAKYKVAVFRKGELDQPLVERTGTGLAAALEAGALSEGSYLWSVTPLSATDEALRGGRMNKLDLVYDNSVPTLLIRAPQNRARVGRKTRTMGVAPVGTRLFINGREVALDEKSRFDTEASPAGNPPVLIYRLDRPNAADAIYVRTVIRSRG